MYLDFSEIDPRQAYFWMASTITPRPVAWVSTRSRLGITNLAPFSFFQMITASPPTLMISPLVNNGDGSLKDTPRNIGETGEFVVNLVTYPMVEAMNRTSFGFDADCSEFETCGIEALASTRVRPPRVAGATVSFECTLARLMPYPAEKPSCAVIFGTVVAAHIDESILTEDRKVDPNRLDVVSRMGGDWYGRTRSTENFELTRPAGWQR